VWFSDSLTPGSHGETLAQTSTLASENYTYDNTGRLLETQETPAGKGCSTRTYAYDEESNHTSLTTRQPGSEGKCATEGGTIQRHVYDEANRLTDEGIEYEPLGNTTKLPAADAEGHEIKSTYYLDNQVATQEQNHVLDSYLYDPAGRTMQTSSENTETKAKTTLIDHYAGPGEATTWTSEGTEKWSRNIPGIDGSLQAIEETDKVVVLQLSDLQGNIVATAADNESETKLISTYNSTEFGVPSEGKTPPQYAWLGANGLATETAFGTGIATQAGASYVPQVARDLQTAPVVPPGAFPNGQGTGEQYGAEIPGWYISLSGQESAATLAEWTAEQEALKREAEEIGHIEEALGADPLVRTYWDERQVDEAVANSGGPLFLELLNFTHGIEEFLKKIPTVGSLIQKLTGLHTPSEWMYALTEGVQACFNDMAAHNKNKKSRCELTVPFAEPFGALVPDLSKMPVVSLCWNYRKYCGSYGNGKFNW
jgi:hypothetical protein